MATELVKILADFSTQLLNGVAIGDTTATLVSVTDDDNVALPNGSYGFTIDGDNSAKEYIVCTITGTAVTAVKNITRQGVSSNGFARAHRRGAKVAVTDWITLGKQLDLLDGTTDFDAGTPLGYDANPTLTLSTQFATLGYLTNGSAVYWTDTGAADAMVITPSPAFTSYAEKMWFFVKAAASNTGATTINVNGLGVKSIKKDATTALASGDITIGEVILLVYDGTNFQLVGGASGGGAGSGTGSGGSKIEINTTEVVVANTTVETTLFTVSIPGGLLSTNNGIRYNIPLKDVGMLNTNGETLTIRVKYGATTINTLVINDPETQFSNIGGHINGSILADGATNAQKGFVQMALTNNYGETQADTAVNITKMQGFDDGTATEDSTVAKNLVVTAQWSDASATNTLDAEAIVVEAIVAGTITVKKNIPSASVLTLNATPVTLVSAPLAGHAYLITGVMGRIVYNTTAYTTNLNLQIKEGGTAISSNSDLLADTATTVRQFALSAGTVLSANAITASVATGNPVAGDSPIDIYVSYIDVTL